MRTKFEYPNEKAVKQPKRIDEGKHNPVWFGSVLCFRPGLGLDYLLAIRTNMRPLSVRQKTAVVSVTSFRALHLRE